MKVILVNGSPNPDGCCRRALKEMEQVFADNAIECEVFWIGRKPIGGCLSCGYCREHGVCVMNDVVNDFARKADTADAFVFASPVYYAGMAGGLKSFMDRLFYSSSKSLRHKPAAMVVSSRRAGSTSAWDDGNKYFGLNQMPIMTSTYWNEVHGFTKEDVEKDLEGLQSLRILARNMVFFLRCLEAGKKAGVEQDATEKRVATNFVS